MTSLPHDLPKERALEDLVLGYDNGAMITADVRERELLEKLRAAQDEPEPVLRELTLLYHQTGNLTLAEAYVGTLLERCPRDEDRAGLHLTLGQICERREDFETAARHYRRVLALQPASPQLQYYGNNNLGYCLNQAERFAEAERHCRRAIEIDPDRHNAHKNLGVALEGQGDFVEAARSYARAMQRTGMDFRSLAHMERLLESHPEVAEHVEDLAPYRIRRIRWDEEKREIVEEVVQRFGKAKRADADEAGGAG